MDLIVKEEKIIRRLTHLLRVYDGLKKVLSAAKNRLHALGLDESDHRNQDEIMLIEKLKNKMSRETEKILEFWPIYDAWLKDILGIGPYICGNLILLYYYRFVPICHKCDTPYERSGEKGERYVCKKCKAKASGEGLLKTKIERKEFSTISKWWKYMGRAPGDDGKLPKRKKGVKINWSPKGREIGFQFGDQVNRQQNGHKYKFYLLERKEYREKTHPEASRGYRHNMAKNETIKLFLSHFWHVARTLEGQSTDGPYILTVGGHTGVIPPYYWEGLKD